MKTPSPQPSSPGGHRGRGVAAEPPVVPDHTLLRMIGRGSYGEVWLVRNVMGTYRAVKVVYRDTFDNDQPYEREFAGIRKFEPVSRSHESQVDILQIGRNDAQGYFYYVMELADDAGRVRSAECGVRNAEGQPLEATIRPESYVPRTLQHDLDTRGRLPYGECLDISLGLAGALKHLHERGLVHRDIKPSNIIFVHGIPKLADIGLVTESEATISYVGAQGFMPPEGPGRPQGDLYSLGKVIYEMCTGRDRMAFPALPEDFGEWSDRRPVLELLAVSLKACEPDPQRRYTSAAQVAADLVLLQAGKSIKRLRWLERNRRWALAAAGLALLLASGGWWVQLQTRAREQARRREVLVRQSQMMRFAERQGGWSSNALRALAEAGQIRIDADLRNQAAATLEGLDAQTVAQLSLSNRPYSCIDLDAEGRRLLIAGATNMPVKLWDVQTGAVKDLAAAGPGPVWFAEDGSPRQLTAVTNHALAVVRADDGHALRELALPAGLLAEAIQLWPFALSTDRSLAAAVVSGGPQTGRQFHLLVWNLSTGQLLAHTDTGTNDLYGALAFAPDGHSLAIGDTEGYVRLWTLPGWEEVVAFGQDRVAVHCLAVQHDLSPRDGPAAPPYPWLIAAGDAGGTVNIYQVAGRRLKTICRGSVYDVYSVAFCPDGMTLVSGGRGRLKFWDVGSGRCLLQAVVEDFGEGLLFSGTGSNVAVLSQDYFAPSRQPTIRLLSIDRHRGVMGLRGFSSPSGLVEFSHNGRRLAALSHNWQVGVWELGSGCLEHLFEAPKGFTADNAALCFSPDDSQLAFATLTNACLWNLPSGQRVRSWDLPQGLVQQLCFDPAGRLLLFQCDRPWQKDARMCRTRDLFAADYRKPLAEFPEFRGRVASAVLSRRGDFVAIGGQGTNANYTAKAYDPVSGRELWALEDYRAGEIFLARDPQSKLIGYWDPSANAAKIFEMPAGRLCLCRAGIRVSALGPQASWMTGSGPEITGLPIFGPGDETPRLIVGIDYAPSGPLPAFSPDGKMLAWGTAAGTVLVCNLQQAVRRLERLGLGWR